MPTALKTLKIAVKSYEPYLQPSGELHDPIIGQPTQYGTPYHAYCQAVLAKHNPGEARDHHLALAVASFKAALKHVAAPALPRNISSVDRETGAVSRLNHRDFFWPPLLKTYRIFKGLGLGEVAQFGQQLANVDILQAFNALPPSNWAMVWLSGEWLRLQEGLSPYSETQIDEWLDSFFQSHILLGQGFYQEPGHPNSYDLFTRYHMADMRLHGYTGAWQKEMETLLETGFQRSLQVQLSDGSLASAHRSTGQTWTLGVQCAYFTHAANFFQNQGKAEKAAQARAAAQRAFAAFTRWQRPNGPYSPVENLLPPAYRVGYETYTADGHYANLAMGFLATAIDHGFVGTSDEPLPGRTATTFIESDPTDRVVIHNGRYSLQANARPAPQYDGFGITDLTFGPGKQFHFVSTVRHLGSGKFYNLGLALRPEAGLAPIQPAAQQSLTLLQPIEQSTAEASFILTARPIGAPFTYELMAQLHDDGAHIEERTPRHLSYKTLLIPYLRDNGSGHITQVDISGAMIRFRFGPEQVCMEVYGEVEHALNLPYGFENRRGLCGLIRLDMAEPREGVSYRLVSEG